MQVWNHDFEYFITKFNSCSLNLKDCELLGVLRIINPTRTLVRPTNKNTSLICVNYSVSQILYAHISVPTLRAGGRWLCQAAVSPMISAVRLDLR